MVEDALNARIPNIVYCEILLTSLNITSYLGWLDLETILQQFWRQRHWPLVVASHIVRLRVFHI